MRLPTKGLKKLVLEKKTAHRGHLALTRMIGNIYARIDLARNIKPDKVRLFSE